MRYRSIQKLKPKSITGKKKKTIAILCFAVLFFCVLSWNFYGFAAENYRPVSARIPIFCSMVTDRPDEVYEIQIQKITQNAPTPTSDRLHVKGAESGYMEIEITEPGTYKYRVSQILGKSSDISYDNKVYDVYLCVTDNGTEKLDYAFSVTLENSSVKPDEIYFENYIDNVKPPTPPSEDPPAQNPDSNPDSNPSANRTGAITGNLFSMKTGEKNPLYIGMFAGTMLLLAVGAVVYILVKRNSDRKKED